MHIPDEQPVLSGPTDTANPITPIPIFYLHEGDHPFCRTHSCICHKNDRALAQLLLGVIERKLTLVEVAAGAIKWEGN